MQTFEGKLNTLEGSIAAKVETAVTDQVQTLEGKLNTLEGSIAAKVETAVTDQVQTLEGKLKGWEESVTVKVETTVADQVQTFEGKLKGLERSIAAKVETTVADQVQTFEGKLKGWEESVTAKVETAVADQVQTLAGKLGAPDGLVQAAAGITKLADRLTALEGALTLLTDLQADIAQIKATEWSAPLLERLSQAERQWLEQFQTLRAPVEQLAQQVAELQGSSHSVQQQLVGCEQRVLDAQTQIGTALETQAEATKTLVDALQFQWDEWKAQIEASPPWDQVQRDIAAKQLLIGSLQTQLSDLSQTLNRLKDEVVYKDQIEVADTITDEFDSKLQHIQTALQAEVDRKLQQTLATVEQQLASFRATPAEDQVQQEVQQYRQQIQSLRSYLEEFQLQNADELKTLRTQLSTPTTNPDVTLHIEDCQKEIQRVEGRLGVLLTELEALHQENQAVQAHAAETTAVVTDLKEGHSSLRAQIPPIRDDILNIEKRIDAIKTEFTSQNQSMLEKVVDVDASQRQLVQSTEHWQDTYRLLDEQFQLIRDTFKTQYETLQKRYQELHTIMVSNMEETERGNQSVRELIELHARVEQEYKDMTQSYDQQQKEYKMSLLQRDGRLQLLEEQVKLQLDNVDHRLTCLQNQTGDAAVGKPTLSARLDELAQPRHITPKKLSG